jgi:hypothetical protein
MFENGPQRTEDVVFPPAWCDRVQPDPYELLGTAAVTYDEAQYSTCTTAKLTQAMDNEHVIAWVNYLIDYTHALAGCELPDPSLGGRGFLPGGILRFGPANLSAIDLPQPRFGRAEADILIDQYVGAFAEAVPLSTVERAALTTFLSSAAQSQIDELLAGSLSACGEAAPTGG